MLPLDTTVQAEYEDGFVLDETEQNDVSLYVENENTFADILKERPQADHGKMIRFSCFWKNQRYDIDWTKLPDNARPIRFRHGFARFTIDGSMVESGFEGVDFGCQWNDPDGKNQKEVLELR